MLKFSYHNHTNYSDAADTPEAMAQTAFEAGFTHFAFTDHIFSATYPDWTLNPHTYQIYTEHINRLKSFYAGRMQIVTGIEADWYKGKKTHFTRYEELLPLIDFTVGSIHVLSPGNNDYLIDGSLELYMECLNDGYAGNVQAMITDYFETYTEMAAGLKPQLLGHIDIMRKNNPLNRFFNENDKWLIKLQENLAKEIKKLDLVTEINGGGAYRYHNDVIYPSPQFLHILKDAGVKLTVGLDAHSTDMINSYYTQSLTYAKHAGLTRLYYFEDGIWKPVEWTELN